MARMRYLNEAYAEIVKQDPHTCISKNYVRKLIISGAVPSVKIGQNRRLVDLDKLLRHIDSFPYSDGKDKIDSGILRRID